MDQDEKKMLLNEVRIRHNSWHSAKRVSAFMYPELIQGLNEIRKRKRKRKKKRENNNKTFDTSG